MPRLRLTALHLDKLAAVGGRRTDYADSLCPGLVLRVSPSGVRSWAVRYHIRRAGRRMGAWKRLGRYPRLGLADARDAAQAALRRIDLLGGQEQEAGELTVARLLERCISAVSVRPGTRAEYERLARAEIGPAFGPREAADVERAEVRAWQRQIAERSGYTSNRAFALLRRAYSWGLGEELVDRSPCLGLRPVARETASERVLSAEELAALVLALDDLGHGLYEDATRLLLLTGVRRGAVMGARRGEFQDLGGPGARWVVPGGPEGRSKSGRAHVVPLSPQAEAVVRRRLEAALGECLFPVYGGITGEDLPAWWPSPWVVRLRRAVNRRAGGLAPDTHGPAQPLPTWKIHGLRHALGTHLVEDLGFDHDLVALVLGHAGLGSRVTHRYQRATRLQERRSALSAWAGWLDALISTPARSGKRRRAL